MLALSLLGFGRKGGQWVTTALAQWLTPEGVGREEISTGSKPDSWKVKLLKVIVVVGQG